MTEAEPTPTREARRKRLFEDFHRDHQNRVNIFLHLGVGYPMIAAAVLLLPFRPLWSVALVVGAYAFMFTGHFAFERNTPTLFKHPTAPLVLAVATVRGIFARIGRLFGIGRRAQPNESQIRSNAA